MSGDLKGVMQLVNSQIKQLLVRKWVKNIRSIKGMATIILVLPARVEVSKIRVVTFLVKNDFVVMVCII